MIWVRHWSLYYFRQAVIVNYVGFYGETTMAVQVFGDYPGAMEFVEVLKLLLGMTWWFMMMDSDGLKKQEKKLLLKDIMAEVKNIYVSFKRSKSLMAKTWKLQHTKRTLYSPFIMRDRHEAKWLMSSIRQIAWLALLWNLKPFYVMVSFSKVILFKEVKYRNNLL